MQYGVVLFYEEKYQNISPLGGGSVTFSFEKVTSCASEILSKSQIWKHFMYFSWEKYQNHRSFADFKVGFAAEAILQGVMLAQYQQNIIVSFSLQSDTIFYHCYNVR